MIPAHITFYTPFTSMFLHGGFGHIIGNMWFLWIFGDNLESVCGKWKFLLFYVLSGLFAGFLHFMLYPASNIPTIGASGAIAGVLGAYLVLYPKAKVLTLIWFFVITTARIPAVMFLGLWFILQLFLGSIGIMASVDIDVAYRAHVGGFVAGAGLILALRNYKPVNALV
jgi:membrane associated rhomboid family serine protease